MVITHVNNTDLPGRIFNGYDLSESLNEFGYDSKQIVIDKYAANDISIPLLSKNELVIRQQLMILEKELSMNSMIFPYSRNLIKNERFIKSDIIHYHLINNHFLSISDLNKLSKIKKTIWTIHDPWIVTGHCIHPIACNKWLNGCEKCSNLDDNAFPLNIDKANELWKIKKDSLKDVDLDLIVSSNFMIKYLEKSPITSHIKKIHKIPFGIDINKVKHQSKTYSKEKLNIKKDNIVIGFRNELNKVKGVAYIEEALLNIDNKENITILTVGNNKLSENIKLKYDVIELGWQNDSNVMDDFYNALDMFLMPSLAETFGLMAIEAMAHRCPIIVFKDTVLEEITFSPSCGIAVQYKSSLELAKAIVRLVINKPEREIRGELGKKIVEKHYKYSEYVNKHIKLYQEILYS